MNGAGGQVKVETAGASLNRDSRGIEVETCAREAAPA
jgi:hypothetical protein